GTQVEYVRAPPARRFCARALVHLRQHAARALLAMAAFRRRERRWWRGYHTATATKAAQPPHQKGSDSGPATAPSARATTAPAAAASSPRCRAPVAACAPPSAVAARTAP